MSQKILIVEDDQSLYKALTERFEREGYSVLGAKNGEEGLSIALEEKPVLILLDIIMPKKDGISMLADLRKDEWGKNVPVIMLSNLSDTEKMAEAAEKDISEYLVKSDWKIEDVVDKVKEKIGE